MYDSAWYKLIVYGLEFIGRYYSSYRGFVVMNDDPRGLNRVKIISPTINAIDDKVGIWAYPKGNWGAKGYGVQMLPMIGDMVWVEFEYGDLEHPIWSFASYGTDEKPTEFDTPFKYGFKTPAGSIVIIDDTEGEESILVKHKDSTEYIDIVKDKITLEGVKIYLGVRGDEYAVMGETLKKKMETLINTLETHTHTTNTGPSGPPINVGSMTSVKNTLQAILSDKVKLDK